MQRTQFCKILFFICLCWQPEMWASATRGLPLAWLLSTIALIPTFIVLGIVGGIFVGGGMLRRQKRGRPDTWLYRQLQWVMATRYPLLSGWVGGHGLIARAGFWSCRRQTL